MGKSISINLKLPISINLIFGERGQEIGSALSIADYAFHRLCIGNKNLIKPSLTFALMCTLPFTYANLTA
jgi:hypothetical protein